MKKITKHFSFEYALRQKVVENLRVVTKTVGTLFIECTGYFDPNFSPIEVDYRYGVDVDYVLWNAQDIKAVLEVTGGLDEIEEAALHFFANLIEEKLIAA